MQMFLAFIELWWPQIVFLLGAFVAVVKYVKKQSKAEETWKSEIDAAIVAILHGLIWDSGIKVLNRGEATFEEMDNLNTMYEQYKKRGGNGTIKNLMNRIYEHVHLCDVVENKN